MTMKAKLFIFKLVFFFTLNLGILAGLLFYFSGQHRDIHLGYAQSESNLLVLGEKTHYPVAVLGTSRGRVFSRDGNHTRVEQILGGRVANLSKGGGGGLMPAEVHLAWFYHRENRADHVIYLVDPWVFYSSINNENNDFFLRDEPFELFIFLKLIRDGYSTGRLFSYLQMIAVTDWKRISLYGAPGLTSGTLKKIDPKKTEDARRNYLDKFDQKSYTAYGPVVERINRLVRQNSGRITYVMLPLLMADFPGLGEVDAFLRETAARTEGMDYYNCASCMQETKWYYDHMHFNKAGIGHFLQYGVLPLLEGKKPLLEGVVIP